MSDLFCKNIELLHESGDILYPVRMKNQKTGKTMFRVCKEGNRKDEGGYIELDDEAELLRHVKELDRKVRASTLNKSRYGLYRTSQRAIEKVTYSF